MSDGFELGILTMKAIEDEDEFPELFAELEVAPVVSNDVKGGIVIDHLLSVEACGYHPCLLDQPSHHIFGDGFGVIERSGVVFPGLFVGAKFTPHRGSGILERFHDVKVAEGIGRDLVIDDRLVMIG